MSPTLESCIRSRSSRLAVLPILLAVLGLLSLVPGVLVLVNRGDFSQMLLLGAVLFIAGIVLFVRSRNIANDPVHRVLAHPETVTAFRVVRTNLTAAGAKVSSVDSVVISHRGGADVWLPVRGVPMDDVLRDLKALAPHASVA